MDSELQHAADLVDSDDDVHVPKRQEVHADACQAKRDDKDRSRKQQEKQKKHAPCCNCCGVDAKRSVQLQDGFQRRKQQILSNLDAPIGACDLSPKGSVDELCIPIITLLNASGDYVTTSSCSGRISVFHMSSSTSTTSVAAAEVLPTDPEEVHESTQDNNNENKHDDEASSAKDSNRSCEDATAVAAAVAASRKKRGGVGNAWLYVTHGIATRSEVDHLISAALPAYVCSGTSSVGTEAASSTQQQDLHPSCEEGSSVSIKFEPFIMHVQCRTMEAAKKLQTAATDAGYRNSGVVPPGTKIMLAIRHTSCVDAPIIFGGRFGKEGEAGEKKRKVPDAYVRELILGVCNDKMRENEQRMAKLAKTIELMLAAPKP